MAIHLTPIDYIDIPAPQHSAHAFYRVIYGDVDWNEDRTYRRSVYIVMGEGDDILYEQATYIFKTSNEPRELTDLDKVLAAIEKLKERNQLDVYQYA